MSEKYEKPETQAEKMSEKYEKPETQAEEKKGASAQGACGQRYTMRCGALVEKW